MSIRPIFIHPRTFLKSPLTNAQIGALLRLQCHANIDPDGALPEGVDLIALSQWDGTAEDFSAVRSKLIAHPTKPSCLTTHRALHDMASAERKAKQKAENAAKEAARQAEAQAKKEAARQARAVAPRPTIQKPSKLASYSF